MHRQRSAHNTRLATPRTPASNLAKPGSHCLLSKIPWRDRVLIPLMLALACLYHLRAQAQADTSPGVAVLMATSAQGDGYVVLPYLDSEVDIEISGMIARVRVSQHFFNDTGEWLEGSYLFPLPENAAVDRLRMTIGERVIEGEIREKEQARREFAEARRKGQRASLVEQQRPNLFSTDLTNLAPDEHIVIEISYLQQLDYEDGNFSLRYPMTLTPRYAPGEHAAETAASNEDTEGGTPEDGKQAAATALAGMLENTDTPGANPLDHELPVERAALFRSAQADNQNMTQLSVSLNAGFPLDRLESDFHDVSMDEAGEHRWWIQSELVPADRDFVLRWSAATGFDTQAAVFTETRGEDTYVLAMIMPPQQLAGTLPPRDLIFVIDTSGSMLGDSLKQARAALLWGLDTLRPEDRFNVVQFNSEADQLFSQATPVSSAALSQAHSYIDQLEAQGGTDIGLALDLVLAQPADPGYLRQVVFVTDGSVSNEQALFAQIEAQIGDTRLFTVGIGSAPNSYFMRKAAQFGRGTFSYIGDPAQVGTRMSELFTKLEFPVLRDLCVDFALPAQSYPAQLPDLYLGQPVVLSARYRGNPTEMTLCGDGGAGQAWTQYLDLTRGEQHDGVAALWARRRIENLTDSLVMGADRDQVRAEVVETALAHHLVSPYTSLIAVDKTPARSAAQQLKRQQIANNLPAGHSVGLPQGATGLPAYLLMAAFGITLLTLAWRMGTPEPLDPRSPQSARRKVRLRLARAHQGQVKAINSDPVQEAA